MRALIGEYTDIWSRADVPPTLMPPVQRVLFLQAMDRVERANRPDLFSMSAGQVLGMMNEDTACKEIVYSMQKELAEAIESLGAATQHLMS